MALAINPKKYFEYFQSTKLNKKHKGIKKRLKGMDYENYAARIKPLDDFETYEKRKRDYKEVVRFAVKKRRYGHYKNYKNRVLSAKR